MTSTQKDAGNAPHAITADDPTLIGVDVVRGPCAPAIEGRMLPDNYLGDVSAPIVSLTSILEVRRIIRRAKARPA